MNMTTRVDAHKTNEFLRRRKLRLQQVREQSKDIARKIRQRTKVENLRHLDSIDAKREKEYFDCQEKLVKHLELLYSKGLQNVGASHKDALEVTDRDCVKKTDISKLRGKEAAEALRKKKQEKLDEQRKLLDRKLQAREAANELSREKSAVLSKNLAKPTSKKCEDIPIKPLTSDSTIQTQTTRKDNVDVLKNDMGTQWESEELPNEWEPNVPVLSLPKDDSVKESQILTEKTDKSKRLNLFALSDEMPSSLRGGLTGISEDDPVPTKPSLTLVSEYLQNRNLRLRQPEQSSSKKDDLQSIKQTILRTRAARTDGNKDKSSHSTEPNTSLSRKKSVTVYNHNTRNMQDIPCSDERIVSRDDKTEEDAYAQALKETTIANSMEKEQSSKHQKDMRNKIAVTKNNVDKEYKDTLAFLNSFARDKNEKPIKTAYMDEHHQQIQNERHQRKLQEEFKKIEKECYKHNCKHSKRKATISEDRRNKSRSPVQREMRKDFEYSWMPVPESDGSLAVHTIPNTNTRNKSGNTVKFGQPDSYHEYRSRHKHTPPTKDVSTDRESKRVVETVILQESNDSEVIESSETSSVENLNLEKDKTGDDSRLKDAERIIIYKIFESKKDKKRAEHKKDKTNTRVGNSAAVTDEVNKKNVEGEKDKQKMTKNMEKSACDIQRGVSFEQLHEGVYEAVNSDGDNIASMYFTEGENENDARNRSQTCNKTVLSCCCSRSKDFKDGGDNARLFQKTSSCKCSSGKKKENSNSVQASAATSSTSFTTAFNDRTNNRLPDGGFVKLIEDEGQESNKFYVGASGFLKDDNYEVVIQLRKKETEKVNHFNKHQPSTHTKPGNSLDVIQEIEPNIQENASVNTLANDGLTSPVIIAPNSETNKKIENIQHDKAQSLNNDDREVEMPQTQNLDSPQKKLCEKAVHTSFQDDFTIPNNALKSDPTSRPGTSTYTQTSFNLSVPRPAFMHMSSSTSTAYMSPPELILPKFLKQNYRITKEDLYESENTTNQLDSNFEVIENEHSNEFNYTCRVSERHRLKTPPNTARSCNKSSASEYVKAKKRKCKCHKCRSRNDTSLCRNTHRIKSSTSKIKSSRDLPSKDLNAFLKQSAKNKPLSTHSSSKANIKIKPVVKDYVNKLLALNSEGLKAIEIINQDCSAVTTPGSSIINLPCNKKIDKSNVENKISLEQIRNILKQQILKENLLEDGIKSNSNSKTIAVEKISIPTIMQNSFKLPKKKSLHKVKSLNISKHILKKKKPSESYIPSQRLRKPLASVSSSTRDENKSLHTDKQKNRYPSQISNSPRKYANSEYKNSTSSDVVETSNSKPCVGSGQTTREIIHNKPCKSVMYVKSQQKKKNNSPWHRAVRTSFSSDSDATGAIFRHLHQPQQPTHTATQTNGIIDTEIHFMKIAEDKLQNMEKIADLTEKCTKRLSNLAKVLEEVRRNKSLAYSQISASDSTPESETKANNNEVSTEISGHTISDPNILSHNKESVKNITSLSIPEKLNSQNLFTKEDSKEFTPLLKDIPKPDVFTTPFRSNLNDIPDKATKVHIESDNTKIRGKPPPAFSRINLKCGEDSNIIPHELSTVVEVDSPMSMRVKSQSSRHETKAEMLENSDHGSVENDKSITNAKEVMKEISVDPDLLKTNFNLSRRLSRFSSTDSSDDSKMRMMDMNKFNDIMLKPFISINEYAKQCNIGLDEGSNHDDLIKDDPINDDLSSLHSDGSLPDVIAELLKRNIISEPFKFDTGSNVNSTTISSESTLSVIALSKARKERKKSAVFLKNKENTAETSGTLSLSSNPDLENAFQKLGMGWASSTLKKTKERLALSSSSNTSSSSMTQFKIKSFSQDLPNLATDSTSSLLEVANKRDRKMSPRRFKNLEETSRNAVQQTSLSNSMTVKEFLTNELANKITFNNKSTRKGDEEFVSLYETKMPDEMKHTKVGFDEEQLSVNQNRARTSTPVQIFRSQTYHSTSTSNTSNGFFSNADDLSSVKVTSASIRNHSTSDKDDLTIPNYSLKTKKGLSESGCSKSD